MREITLEIREQLRIKAITTIQDGNALLVIPKDIADAYLEVLIDMYKNNQIEIGE